MSATSDTDGPIRFSVLRVLAVATPLLVLAAGWVQLAEIYLEAGGVSGGAISPGAFGLFVLVLLPCVAIPALRRRWKVTRAELVAVFCVLLLALPILGPGLWSHFVPLQNEYHRTRNLDRAMSISRNLWPNRGNVLEGRSAEDQAVAGVAWTIGNTATTSVGPEPDGPEQCVRTAHTVESERSEVMLELDRTAAPRFVTPKMRYAVFARMRLDDSSTTAVATLSIGTDPKAMTEIASIRRPTEVSILAPTRFVITGMIDYPIPRDTGDRLYLRISFAGRGKLYVKDVSMVDTEAVYRYLEGYEDSNPEVHAALSDVDRSLVRLRPKRWTLAYARHVVLGLVPWRSWAKPLMTWGFLVVGMFLAMFCLVTLFFRHWERGDRLTFPLQTFVTELTRGDDRRGPAILRSGPFWIGFGLCTVFLCLQQLNSRFPEVPCIRLELNLSELLPAGPLRDAIKRLTINIRPLYVAVAFFISMELSFSLVVFYLLGWVFRFVGYFTPLKTLRVGDQYYFRSKFPFAPLLIIGGLGAMAVLCVFSARKHLKQVARKVFLGRGELDDSQEALSYRWATLGLLVSLVLLTLFARRAEISSAFVLIYLSAFLLLALSAARIRAEAGIPSTGLMVVLPQEFLAATGGAILYGFREITFTAESFFLNMGLFLMAAPILAESMALATRAQIPMRKLGRCMIGGFVIAVVVGGVVTMSWGYTVGALNMNKRMAERRGTYNRMTTIPFGDDVAIQKHFRGRPDEPRVLTKDKRREISEVQPAAVTIVSVSFVITGLLAVARMIWLGFPLHPLGFALSFTDAMNAIWSSVAVGWCVKSLGLRFGGVRFNRGVLRPFFVGLFTCDLLMSAIWCIVEMFIQASQRGAGS